MKYLIAILLIFLPFSVMAARLENIIKTGSENPNAKPNRAFIDGLYLEFHKRQATDKEMERFKDTRVWDASNIIAGKQILKKQQASPKARDKDVKDLYWKYFVRKPSQAEMDNWGNKGGRDVTIEALNNFLKSEIPKGVIPWESKYNGQRYENEVNINEDADLRKRQIIGDYATRYKANSPINVKIAKTIPDEFILAATPKERVWLQASEYKIYGLYNWNNDKTFIKDTDDYFFINNFSHELGHNLDKDFQFNEQKNLFNNVINNNSTINNTLNRIRKESIADNFSLYVQNPENYKKENPAEYDCFEKTLKQIPDQYILK